MSKWGLLKAFYGGKIKSMMKHENSKWHPNDQDGGQNIFIV
jgi:hypothetical protein